MNLPLTAGRIAIDGTLRDTKDDDLGSSNISPLRVESSSVYFDLFSLEEGLSFDREHFLVVFLGAIVESSTSR